MRLTMAVLLTAMLGVSISFAQDARVDVAEAAVVAGSWLGLNTGQGKSWDTVDSPRLAGVQRAVHDGLTLGYCFEVEPSGFIFVTGSRDLYPIKAYSSSSHIDIDAGVGLARLIRESVYNRMTMEGRGGKGGAADRSRLFYGKSNADVWSLLAGEDKSLGPTQSGVAYASPYGVMFLIGSQWHQGEPYNDFCPPADPACLTCGDGGTPAARCLVGCVATASAQIFRFHRWPSSGQGSTSYIWNGDNTCTGSQVPGPLEAFFADPYDWDNMPTICLPTSTPDEKDAVAELCYEVGVAFEMDYGSCTSWSNLHDAPAVYRDHFGYGASTWDISRADYSLDEWFGIIQAEILSERPILYGIRFAPGSGHALVCHGWKVTTGPEINLNYGWGGHYEAWFSLDDIDGSYDHEQEVMVGNIMPEIRGPDCLDYAEYEYGAPISTSVILPDSVDSVFSQEHCAIVVENDMAYVTMAQTGMQIVDISDPDAPRLRGYVAQPGIYWEDAAYPYLYCSGSAGVWIYDVSDPDSPAPGAANSVSGFNVRVAGDLLLVTSSSGLKIYDRSEPANPVYVTTASGIRGHVLEVAGDYAYSVYENGFFVVDISAPAAPVVVGSLTMEHSPEYIELGDGYAYLGKVEVAASPMIGEISVVDISDATSPSLVSVCQTPVTEMKYKMAYGNGDLYFAGASSVYALDVSNPESPSIRGRARPGGVGAVAYNQGRIYGVGILGLPNTLQVMWPQCGSVSAVPTPRKPAIAALNLKNSPNPFNPRTTISFEMQAEGVASLRIYDVSGRLVRVLRDNEMVEQGHNEVDWTGHDDHGRRVASGVYFYRLEAGGYSETRKMVLVK